MHKTKFSYVKSGRQNNQKSSTEVVETSETV